MGQSVRMCAVSEAGLHLRQFFPAVSRIITPQTTSIHIAVREWLFLQLTFPKRKTRR